jgi:acetylornithine deacetylase/succinyl-diaminopimelate desuccinylase-like protein
LRRFASLLTLSAGLALAAAGVAGAQQPPFPSPPPALTPLPGNLPQLETDAQGWLSDLVRINTTNPPGNEAAAAQYVAAVLQKENIASEIVEMAPGRSIAIGRLQAGPLPDPSKALLLVAHLDVVGADKTKWTVDPFGAIVKDGYLYGRGVIDDKSMLAANLAAIVELKRSGAHLNRDVIFLADDDEEQGGAASIRAVAEKYWDKIACAFALNEGGMVVLKNGKVQYVAVQASEKVSYNVAVTATGASGSASTPSPDNPVVHLAAAIEKIATMETPVEVTTIPRRYFEQLAPVEDEETSKWMRALVDMPERFQLAAKRISDMNPMWGAMIRDSIAPTELRAGDRANAIPSQAWANLNVRVLPGNPVNAVVLEMQKAVNDPQIHFQVEPDSSITAPPSSLTSDLYTLIERLAPQEFPGAVVVPFLSSSTTDSAALRFHNVEAYGLLPFPLTDADALRGHTDDERIPLASFRTGVEFLYRTVYEFTATK